LAHSSRGWTGARTPQALKRVRQSTRRNAVLQPRRSAAKTEVKDALAAATSGDVETTSQAVAAAASALDRAAKVGAIHPNTAARRKSRLMLRVNAALGGEAQAAGKTQRQTSKSAQAKAAKARIAAGKATKAKGEQTAAGKARAALSKSSRSTDASGGTDAGGTAKASSASKSSGSKATSSGKATSSSKASTSGKAAATKKTSTSRKPTTTS
jgi:small subunit ribosomal protein S20